MQDPLEKKVTDPAQSLNNLEETLMEGREVLRGVLDPWEEWEGVMERTGD